MAAAAAAIGVLAAPSAPAIPKVPHFTIYTYKLKIGVKGGANQDGTSEDLPYHFNASYSIDEMFPTVVFAVGKVPGYRNSFSDTQRAVLNGTWNERGTVWIDRSQGTTQPYTCSGRVRETEPQGSAVLDVTKKGSTLRFRVEVLADDLTSPGECAPSDLGAQGTLLNANSLAYITNFSLSTRDLGRKTIVKSISGPDARLHWRQYPCQSANCMFTTAWHGVVHFTLTRRIKS